MIPSSDLAQQGTDMQAQWIKAIQGDEAKLLNRLFEIQESVGISMKQIDEMYHLVNLCVKEKADKCLELVLQNGANPNMEDGDTGKISLHHAVECTISQQHHRVNTIKKLISYGANVNHKSFPGMTPLMLACGDGNVANINALIDAHADPKLTNSNGDTCLNVMFYSGPYEEKPIILKALLQTGINPDASTHGNNLPIVEAAIDGDEPCAIMLLEYGANPFLKSPSHQTSAVAASLKSRGFLEHDSFFSAIMRKIFPEFDAHSDKLRIPKEVIKSKDDSLEKYLQSWIVSVKMDSSIQAHPTTPSAPSI